MDEAKPFVDVEVKNSDGYTSISPDAINGNVEIIKFLVCTAGANMETTNNSYSRTPFSLAVKYERMKVVEFWRSDSPIKILPN